MSSDRSVVRFPTPAEPFEFTGERFTPGLLGEIEHEHHHRYLFALQFCAGRDVLDVASGEGYGAALLASVARSVVGVDIAAEAVAHATSSYRGENLSYRQGDCAALPLDAASVDVVVSFETIEHVAAQEPFLAEIKRVLRPGGVLVMSSPVRGVYSAGNPNPFHVHELTRPELEALVRGAFREAVYLAQTPLVGSALVPDEPAPPGVAANRVFWKREDGAYDAADAELAPYLVVVASDAPIPPIRAGALHDHPYFSRLLGDLEAARADAARASDGATELAARLARAEELGARLRADIDVSRFDLEAALAHSRSGLSGAIASLRRRLDARRIRKSGLFDAGYYRASHPEVPRQGNAIRHFLKHGAHQGLNPHAMFDTRYYLRENPEVSRRGVNPLVHFIAEGAAAGRRPHPGYAAADLLATSARGRLRSLLPPPAPAPRAEAPAPPKQPSASRWRFQAKAVRGAPGRRATATATTIVLTHVLPFPPRAGNEYRIHRMLRWLRSIGHDVHLLVTPLPHEVFDEENVRRAFGEYPNLVLIERDGTTRYCAERADVRAALAALDGVRPRAFPLEPPRSPREEQLVAMERTFCPDYLLEAFVRLQEVARPDVVVSEYIFQSRSLPHAVSGALKVIDTHDVFSTKAHKVLQFGVKDDLALSAAEERAMLDRADLVVAIQPDEARELREIAPGRTVVTAGVDFDLQPDAPPAAEPAVVYVASGNSLNVKGIRDFVSLAWPLVRRQVPGARLRLVGPVCEAVDGGVDGIELLGRIDTLADAYRGARVVINPAVAGTGLKIKTLEALSHGRPIVTWPSGVDGLSPAARRLCHVAKDWYGFARRVAELLAGDDAGALAAQREAIARELSPAAVYGELGAALARRAPDAHPAAAREVAP